jgi:hypothetical protein
MAGFSKGVKIMSLRYGIFCFLLLFVVLVLFLKNYETWTFPMETFPGKEEINKPGTKVDGSLPTVNQKKPESIESNIFIAEKNIFNPERKDFPIISPSMAEQPKKPMVRPKIILYGVTFAEEDQYALISNPGRPLQRGERETMTIKVGDRIGEYQLAKILTDRIIMESPEDTFETLLYDPKTPKTRTMMKTESKPTTITSTSPPLGPTSAEVPRPTPPRETMERPGAETQVPRPSPSPISPAPVPSPRPRVRIAPILPPPSPQTEEREETR